MRGRVLVRGRGGVQDFRGGKLRYGVARLISTGAAERVHGYPINAAGAVLKYAVIDLRNMGPSSDARMQSFWSRACNDATQQPLSHLMDIMTAFR